MDISVLRRAGLTESQAKSYLALIENGPLTPTEMAEKTGETRTNAYAIADKLVALGLATRDESATKATYQAVHPSAVEALAEKRRKIVARDEQMVKQQISSLIDYYYEHTAQPGVQTYYGLAGIEEIRQRTLQEGKTLRFVRSKDDEKLTSNALKGFIKKRVDMGIAARSIAPAEYSTTHDPSQLAAWHLDRTLVPAAFYDSPVEIDVFGDKVAFIDFSNDGMSTLIHSKEIALAMKQLFEMAKSFAPKSDATTRPPADAPVNQPVD